MTMVDHVLCSLKAVDNAMLLEVGLPWFRSVPITCVNGLIVTIDDQQFADVEMQIDDEFLPVRQLANHDLGEWFLQDRKLIRIPAHFAKGGKHKVRAHFDMAIPNIFATPDKPVQLPMIREAELVVQ